VPYHLGLWHWDKQAGWVWIPGSAFAPAWVTWSPCGDSLFRPYGFWDWSDGWGPRSGYAWGCHPHVQFPTTAAYSIFPNARPTPAPSAAPSPEPAPKPEPPRPAHILQLPSELRKVAERYLDAARKGEVHAAESVERANQVAGTAPTTPDRLPSLLDDASPKDRFRDWNDDLRAVRLRGGELRYSRATNSFRCDGCRVPFAPSASEAASSSARANTGGSNSGSGSGGDSGSSPSAAPSSGNNRRDSGDRDRIR
jgi:hypothetical protein